MLAIRDVDGKGRGVFAIGSFRRGDVVECAPVIVIPREQRDTINQTVLRGYCFEWGPDYEQLALLMGYGSFFNHSFTPNVVWQLGLEQRMIRFVALRDIAAGEEITINYNGRPDNSAPLCFDVLP